MDNLFFLYATAGLSSCMWMVLFLYNLVGVISFMREDTGGESASMLSKAAWALGFFSIFVFPCAWFFALVAIGLARFERGRIYKEQSPLAGATPCRMASVNAGITLVLWALVTAGAVATWLGVGAGA